MRAWHRGMLYKYIMHKKNINDIWMYANIYRLIVVALLSSSEIKYELKLQTSYFTA